MFTNWKFAVPIGRTTTIGLPADAEIVHADIDPATGVPAIWARLDTDASRTQRSFRIWGTGRDIEPTDRYIRSMIDRSFVWHAFEVRDPAAALPLDS